MFSLLYAVSATLVSFGLGSASHYSSNRQMTITESRQPLSYSRYITIIESLNIFLNFEKQRLPLPCSVACPERPELAKGVEWVPFVVQGFSPSCCQNRLSSCKIYP